MTTTVSDRIRLRGKKHQMLPVDTVDLSCFVPHNPVSWAVCLYKVYAGAVPVLPTVRFESGNFFAADWASINKLWRRGFYGKGTLSRSEPSWFNRTKRRLRLDEGTELSSEEIIAQRRHQREEFKRQRQELDALERRYKLEEDSANLARVEKLRHALTETKGRHARSSTPVEEVEIRPEDDVLIQEGKLQNIEVLQLSHTETLFLKLIGCIDIQSEDGPVGLKTAWMQILGLEFTSEDSRLLRFIAYAHYRSLGWCVRSGLKFASDFLLYQRGPPFQHAKYTLRVCGVKEGSMSWIRYSGINRVVSGVKKTMVLSYVTSEWNENEFESIREQMECCSDDHEFALLVADLVSHYRVDEVVYHRWVANRNRE
ncbi:unnamed protein product [Kuraishia capsulata CBS 1993]|uniref:tRNA-splicing endonuclease subunit Sen2 n=1 Tax=Kuraishia capsulata CBS 1993 TaxID=1382522 RepID=W6MRA6_9ASCO|nr:uncharacterized protein KUCA_T00000342001 [Kuraishia capsulata CBS 1993]CDK24380.1 unnamed protein product [Kuraishia capsulata CBS 1993]